MNPINQNLSFKGLFVFSETDWKRKNIRPVREEKPEDTLKDKILKDAKYQEAVIKRDERSSYPNLNYLEINGDLHILACVEKPKTEARTSEIDDNVVDFFINKYDMPVSYQEHYVLPEKNDFVKKFNDAFKYYFRIPSNSENKKINDNMTKSLGDSNTKVPEIDPDIKEFLTTEMQRRLNKKFTKPVNENTTSRPEGGWGTCEDNVVDLTGFRKNSETKK